MTTFVVVERWWRLKYAPSGKQSFGHAIKMGLQLAEMGFRRRLGRDLGRDKKMEIVHRLQMGAAKLSHCREIPNIIRISPHWTLDVRGVRWGCSPEERRLERPNQLVGYEPIDMSVCLVVIDLITNRTGHSMLRDRVMNRNHFFRREGRGFGLRVLVFFITPVCVDQLKAELFHLRTMRKLHDVLPSLRTDRALGYEGSERILIQTKKIGSRKNG
jgi:hypothetical protein